MVEVDSYDCFAKVRRVGIVRRDIESESGKKRFGAGGSQSVTEDLWRSVA